MFGRVKRPPRIAERRCNQNSRDSLCQRTLEESGFQVNLGYLCGSQLLEWRPEKLVLGGLWKRSRPVPPRPAIDRLPALARKEIRHE